jgi:hypothetical protein
LSRGGRSSLRMRRDLDRAAARPVRSLSPRGVSRTRGDQGKSSGNPHAVSAAWHSSCTVCVCVPFLWHRSAATRRRRGRDHGSAAQRRAAGYALCRACVVRGPTPRAYRARASLLDKPRRQRDTLATHETLRAVAALCLDTHKTPATPRARCPSFCWTSIHRSRSLGLDLPPCAPVSYSPESRHEWNTVQRHRRTSAWRASGALTSFAARDE